MSPTLYDWGAGIATLFVCGKYKVGSPKFEFIFNVGCRFMKYNVESYLIKGIQFFSDIKFTYKIKKIEITFYSFVTSIIYKAKPF